MSTVCDQDASCHVHQMDSGAPGAHRGRQEALALRAPTQTPMRLARLALAVLVLWVPLAACGTADDPGAGSSEVNVLDDPDEAALLQGEPAVTAPPLREVENAPDLPDTDTAQLTAQMTDALERMQAWGELFNGEAGQQFIRGVAIDREGSLTVCTLTVADTWYQLEDFAKERMVEQSAEQCALVTFNAGLRGNEATPSNYPTTRLKDISGKEVAFKSTFRTKINE